MAVKDKKRTPDDQRVDPKRPVSPEFLQTLRDMGHGELADRVAAGQRTAAPQTRCAECGLAEGHAASCPFADYETGEAEHPPAVPGLRPRRRSASAQSDPCASLTCDHCGSDAITSESGVFRDGDGHHCETCGFPGSVSVDDADEDEAGAYWRLSDEEPNARCADAACTECAGLGSASATAEPRAERLCCWRDDGEEDHEGCVCSISGPETCPELVERLLERSREDF